jgi:carbon storage regulator
MLVLSRRIGEEIVIADDIHVTVLSIRGTQVRLGITAPRSVPVTRLEILAQSPSALLSETAGRCRTNDGQPEPG